MTEKSVLVVERDAVTRATIAEALIRSQLTPIDARSVDEAMRALETESALVAVITTADRENHTTGWTVVQHARAVRPDLEIIYLASRPVNLSAAESAAQDDVIQPISVGMLHDHINRLLARLEPRQAWAHVAASANYYRARAAQERERAEKETDPEARRLIQLLSEMFEQLAGGNQLVRSKRPDDGAH